MGHSNVLGIWLLHNRLGHTGFLAAAVKSRLTAPHSCVPIIPEALYISQFVFLKKVAIPGPLETEAIDAIDDAAGAAIG